MLIKWIQKYSVLQCFYCAILLKTWIIKINAGIVTAISKSLLIILRLKKGFDIFFSSSSFPFLPSPGQVNPQIYIQGQTLPSHFPEDCIMSLFFVAGVDISSSASWRNPSLNALPWGFPQELAVDERKTEDCTFLTTWPEYKKQQLQIPYAMVLAQKFPFLPGKKTIIY